MASRKTKKTEKELSDGAVLNMRRKVLASIYIPKRLRDSYTISKDSSNVRIIVSSKANS